jgi:phosphoribosylformimino-5-aminoimidazole carboxamide ribotide isomerase
VQFGGGLRSKLDIETAIAAGAARVVLGTIAVQQPELVDWAVMRLGSDAVCVALDARAGFVTTHGWQETTAVTAAELGKQMAARGVRHCLYTDVGRDGGLAGVNLEATIALAQDTKLSIIASGGVSSVDDVYSLAVSGLVAGAVIGMALYENRLSLVEAIAAARAGAQDAG